MTNRIISKENTSVLHTNVENKVFICVEGAGDSAAILEKMDDINTDLLEQLKNTLDVEIVKIISNHEDYEILNKSLNLVFDQKIKFVNRETTYELWYRPSPSTIKASKKPSVNSLENVESIQKMVKVLVVDDSTTICNLLTKIMGLSPNIEVVGTINDPLKAEEAIQELKPDVITLDIHMPNLNGVELLKIIWPKYKVPAIMISSISIKAGPLVLEALDSGAVDYIQKPDMSNFAAVANEINTKIMAASKVTENEELHKPHKVALSTNVDVENTLILIGASTGGTKALKVILDDVPDNIPPILIVQHIPAEFSSAFADRLNESAKFEVREAVDGDVIRANQVLVAPGGKQMKFKCKGDILRVEINDDPPVNRFQPSVDYLFDSVTQSSFDKNIVAAIFTGMGKDGSLGMQRLKQIKKATTIAQDQETSVVFGMPKEAIKLGCVDHIVPLQEAASVLMSACVEQKDKKAQ